MAAKQQNRTKKHHMNIRVEENIHQEFKKICEALSISQVDAVTIFIKQVVLHNGIPFLIKIPSNDEETQSFIEFSKIFVGKNLGRRHPGTKYNKSPKRQIKETKPIINKDNSITPKIHKVQKEA